MSYRPGSFSLDHKAAFIAPFTKISLENASCLIDIRSESDVKETSCSPTTPPPLREAKPIEPFSRPSDMPSRTATRNYGRPFPLPLAAASPSIKAVPEGASTLSR